MNDKIHIPTLESIIKLFDSAIYRVDRSKLLSDVFECGAIAISNRVDWRQAEEREKRYLQIMEQYSESERELIVKIFGEIYSLCSSCTHPLGKFGDWLGELYMRSNTSSDKAGQVFTPYDVSKACAKITINADLVEQYKKSGEILSITEPACGSGGMIIAALETLWVEHNFNYATQCFVEASDIDSRCVHMCYLQLSLAGVPAIIKHQDTLSLKKWSVWYTPAHLFQYLRFREYERSAQI